MNTFLKLINYFRKNKMMNYSERFEEKLKALKSPISKAFLNKVEGNNEWDYFDISSDDPKKMSYLDQKKITRYSAEEVIPDIGGFYPASNEIINIIDDKGWINGTWSPREFQDLKLYYSRFRTRTSCAKIINKIWPEKFTQKQIDQFISLWYGDLIKIPDNEFLIDDNVDHWYLSKNHYKQTGQLVQSCMRYRYCQKFFHIYNDNPQIKIAVRHKNRKTVARAILWGDKYFDRIYAITNQDQEAFAKHLEGLGYQDLYNSSTKFSIELDSVSYDHYPYMDTMRYLEGNTLSKQDNWRGDYDRCLDSTGSTSGNCECGVKIRNNYYAKDHEDYYCEKCVKKATKGKFVSQKIREYIETDLGDVIHASEATKFEDKVCFDGDVIVDVEGIRRWKGDCTLVDKKWHISLYKKLQLLKDEKEQKEQEETCYELGV